MTARMPTIPDFAINDHCHPRRSGKFERLRRFVRPQNEAFKREITEELSLIPKLTTSSNIDDKSNLKPKQTHVIGDMNETPGIYWKDDYRNIKKQFPNFKNYDNDYNRQKLKPAIRSSSEHFDTSDYSRKRDFYENPKNFYRNKEKLYTKPLKKVQWEDGYDTSSRPEWYPKKQYDQYNRSYSKSDTSMYSQDYNNKYKNYDNYYYPSYYDTKTYYLPQYKDYYKYNGYDYGKYGGTSNMLYYHNNYTNYPTTADYYKTYKNSITQYDIIDRVHNKKLQVSHSHSESSKISSRSAKLKKHISESKIVKNEVGTQIDDNLQKPIINQQNQDLNKMSETILSKFLTELTDKLKTSTHSVVSEKKCILVEKDTQYKDTDVVKHTKTKVGTTSTSNTVTTTPITTTRRKIPQQGIYNYKNRPNILVLQHESTQYEENKEFIGRNKDFVGTNKDFIETNKEFKGKTKEIVNKSEEITKFDIIDDDIDSKYFKDNLSNENYCEIDRKTLKSVVSEEKIYAKRIIKSDDTVSKSSSKSTKKLVNINKDFDKRTKIPSTSSSSSSSGQQNHHHPRRHHNHQHNQQDKKLKKTKLPYEKTTKHCLPFIVEKEISEEKVEEKLKHKKVHKKQRSHSCDGVKESSTDAKKKIKEKSKKHVDSREKLEKIKSVDNLDEKSLKSDFSGQESSYIEKYVVKLANNDDDIVLYDVKPKFCDYINSKGVKKEVLEKLKLT